MENLKTILQDHNAGKYNSKQRQGKLHGTTSDSDDEHTFTSSDEDSNDDIPANVRSALKIAKKRQSLSKSDFYYKLVGLNDKLNIYSEISTDKRNPPLRKGNSITNSTFSSREYSVGKKNQSQTIKYLKNKRDIESRKQATYEQLHPMFN